MLLDICTLVQSYMTLFKGHEVNGKHGFNVKCYDEAFYEVDNGKIDV